MDNAEYLQSFTELSREIQGLEVQIKNDSENLELQTKLSELEKEKENLFKQKFNVGKEKEQADDVEEVKQEVEQTEEEQDMKIEEGIEADFSGTIQHKFETVEDSQGTMMTKDFDYSIFYGMDSELDKLEKEIDDVKGNTMFSDSYKNQRISEINKEIKKTVEKYEDRAKAHFEELRNPYIKKKTLTTSEEQTNLMKRLNNNIVFSNIIQYASTEDLKSLFELNKDNSEVRAMLLARMNGLIRENPRDSALVQLRAQVTEYDKKVRNIDYFEELDGLEFNLMRLFKQSDRYPSGLSQGLEGYKPKSYVRK